VKSDLKILMLEDDMDDVELIQVYLRRAGIQFNAIVVSDKEEFLHATTHEEYDVVLADNSLPQFNSFDALEVLKKRKNDIPFILVTGTVSEEFAVKIMQYGADDYILKNNLTRLPSAIMQAMERQQITHEKKDAEHELKAAHEKLLFHIENTPLGFVEWDAELYVKSFSKRSEEIFGWTEREVIDNRMNGFDYIYYEDLPKVQEIIRSLVAGDLKRINVQHRSLTKDGTVVWCEWFNAAMRDKDGNITTILSLVQDITERKHSEEKLKETQYFLEKAAKVAKLGYWISELKETESKLDWSTGTLKIFGLENDNFDRNLDTFFKMVHPDDLDYVIKSSVNAIQAVDDYNIDHRIKLADGSIKWVHQQAEITVDDNGKPSLMVGVIQDITDRKHEEEKLQELNDQLRNLTAHLQIIREEERTSIAREVHDELGQQMTSLKMDISFLKNKTEKDAPEISKKAAQMLEMVNEAIRTIRRIITSLRPGILDDLGLEAAIEWQAKEFEQRTGITCTLETSIDKEKLTPNINTTVFRIFQETLNNIVKHAKATSITANLYEKNNALIFEIMDNGIGISDERKNNKTSFGLLGMKERAAMLNGDIRISKMPIKGTSVNLKIPL
jgi:PAS domain S-box-containing protein